MKTKVKINVGITTYKILLFLFIYTVFRRGMRQETTPLALNSSYKYLLCLSAFNPSFLHELHELFRDTILSLI